MGENLSATMPQKQFTQDRQHPGAQVNVAKRKCNIQRKTNTNENPKFPQKLKWSYVLFGVRVDEEQHLRHIEAHIGMKLTEGRILQEHLSTIDAGWSIDILAVVTDLLPAFL